MVIFLVNPLLPTIIVSFDDVGLIDLIRDVDLFRGLH